MNHDRIASREITDGPLAAFARMAIRVGAAARARAQLAPAAAMRARSGALTRALRALEIPAAPARSAIKLAGATPGHQAGGEGRLRPARSLAQMVAAASAAPAPSAMGREAKIGPARPVREEQAARARTSAPRVAPAQANAGPRAARAALGGAAQVAWHANLRIPAARNPGAPRDGAGAHDPADLRQVSFAAIVAQGSAARGLGAGEPLWASRSPTAREAVAGALETRGARRTPAASAAIPVRVRRALESWRAISPATGEQALRAETVSAPSAPQGAARAARHGAGAAAPITINSSPSITVNLPPGTAAPGPHEISQAVAQALEEHAERLYELMRRVAAMRERVQF
jgi:hypothetical protein